MSGPNVVGAVILLAMLVGWLVLWLQARRDAEIVVWFESEDFEGDDHDILWDEDDK